MVDQGLSLAVQRHAMGVRLLPTVVCAKPA